MTDTNTLTPTDAEIDAIADQHKASGHGTVWPHAFARAVLAKFGAPAPASSEPVERQPLTDEQIEALPVWSHFVGLWPENRKEIVRAIEAAQEGDTA